MRTWSLIGTLIVMVCGMTAVSAQTDDLTVGKFDSVSMELAQEKGCLSCHEGIEAIREQGSEMLEQIRGLGADLGDPEGCVICHGGNPTATTKEAAHQGAPTDLSEGVGPQTFYPDPGSIWIADRSCGQCHIDYPSRVEKSLMNTEAGKIQGNLHTWGIPEVQNHKVPWGMCGRLPFGKDLF